VSPSSGVVEAEAVDDVGVVGAEPVGEMDVSPLSGVVAAEAVDDVGVVGAEAVGEMDGHEEVTDFTPEVEGTKGFLFGVFGDSRQLRVLAEFTCLQSAALEAHM
jgi:hypothetical protein